MNFPTPRSTAAARTQGAGMISEKDRAFLSSAIHKHFEDPNYDPSRPLIVSVSDLESKFTDIQNFLRRNHWFVYKIATSGNRRIAIRPA